MLSSYRIGIASLMWECHKRWWFTTNIVPSSHPSLCWAMLDLCWNGSQAAVALGCEITNMSPFKLLIWRPCRGQVWRQALECLFLCQSCLLSKIQISWPWFWASYIQKYIKNLSSLAAYLAMGGCLKMCGRLWANDDAKQMAVSKEIQQLHS